ncbi:MAG: fumarylacetoacetase [Candidatus Meridianibacter frigidus]|nr:MAG: fumarylacetoacetase [Candidatus Eremiobacteraeota bacterium]
MLSWVEVPPGCDFPLENLPYGAFERNGRVRIGVAIGDFVFDLGAAADAGLFDGFTEREIVSAPNLDRLLATSRPTWRRLRGRIVELLSASSPIAGNGSQYVVAQRDVQMRMPFTVGDYVDFYSSLEHATNMGKILRPGGEPLLPNWRHIPIGYHGRSSTVVIDGTPVRRPRGQRKPPDATLPVFAPTAALDIELEVGFVTGGHTDFGIPLPIDRVDEHIFGFVLVNDWSARDIQAWEYQPLGPFLGKSFATSISAWVVTLEALEPYRVAGAAQDPQPLPYLRGEQPYNFDVHLQAELRTARMDAPEIIARTNFREMYWSAAQQLAHVTSNGSNIQPGDLYASGTISGPAERSYGSLMELTWRGQRPLKLRSGEARGFLEDGDVVTLRGWAKTEGKPRIGFGRVCGEILPA